MIGEGQGEESAIGGVEKTESVEARLHLEVGPYLAVDEDKASEELGDPRVFGVAGIGVEELTISGELAVREQERDLVFAGGEIQCVFDGITHEDHAEEPGVHVEAIEAHGVIVVPEGGCFLLERVGADAGLSRDEPIFWMAVVFGRILSAVQMHAGAYFGDVATAAVEGVVDGEEVPDGEGVHPLDGKGMASVDVDERSEGRFSVAPLAGCGDIAMKSGVDLAHDDAELVRVGR